MKPRFSPSEVASLLNQNPYKSKNETLLKILTYLPQFKDVVLDVKKTFGAKTDREVVNSATPASLNAMYKSVNMSVSATSDSQMEKAIDTFKKEHIKQVIQETVEGKRPPSSSPIVREMVNNIKEGKSTLEEACSHSDVVSHIQATQEHKVLSSEIQKRRGIQLEDKAENNYAQETGIEVTNRNSVIQFECPEYRMFGYLDGMQGDKVVETKNRKRFWTTPPAYDFIQLRCYMFMKGKTNGVLLENFPGKPPRTTEVEWDDLKWQEIHQGLCQVANEIKEMTEEEARSIAWSIYSQTM